MLRALGLPFICLAMFSIAGGHWAVLQGIAWVQMVHQYSQYVSVAEAVEKTFSGEAPCSMCKKIAAAKHKEEKAPATVKLDKKAEILSIAENELLQKPAARDFAWLRPVGTSFDARADAPPTPVPILRA